MRARIGCSDAALCKEKRTTKFGQQGRLVGAAVQKARSASLARA